MTEGKYGLLYAKGMAVLLYAYIDYCVAYYTLRAYVQQWPCARQSSAESSASNGTLQVHVKAVTVTSTPTLS